LRLGGEPGTEPKLRVERDGKPLTVAVKVRHFLVRHFWGDVPGP
jgi:hypothetical protein